MLQLDEATGVSNCDAHMILQKYKYHPYKFHTMITTNHLKDQLSDPMNVIFQVREFSSDIIQSIGRQIEVTENSPKRQK